MHRTQVVQLDQGGTQHHFIATGPGGRLVYATCSLLPLENQDRVAAFLSRHPDFRLYPAATVWPGGAVPGLGDDFRATPLQTGTDGFFCAILDRV